MKMASEQEVQDIINSTRCPYCGAGKGEKYRVHFKELALRAIRKARRSLQSSAGRVWPKIHDARLKAWQQKR